MLYLSTISLLQHSIAKKKTLNSSPLAPNYAGNSMCSGSKNSHKCGVGSMVTEILSLFQV